MKNLNDSFCLHDETVENCKHLRCSVESTTIKHHWNCKKYNCKLETGGITKIPLRTQNCKENFK